MGGNVARAAGAHAHARRGFDHGADHLRMLAHSELVVREPDHNRAAGRPGNAILRAGSARRSAQDRQTHGNAVPCAKGKRGEEEMIRGH
jgi:hypothetical protein